MLNLKTQTHTKLNPGLNKHSSVRTADKCICISLCTTVVHNTAQNSSDNFPSYRPDNHHCSDDVYWRGVRPRLCSVACVVLTPAPHKCGGRTDAVWTVRSSSGFVAPPSGGQVSRDVAGPWTPDAPCLLEFNLSAGQRLNVTLIDFASRPGDVTSHVASHADTAQSSSLSDTRRVGFKINYGRPP